MDSTIDPVSEPSTGEAWDDRTLRLLGEDGVERLRRSSVLVVGVGGVGGYAAEMLARSGVGNMTIVDSDNVAESNVNRQLIATTSTVGRPKVELLQIGFATSILRST